MKPAPDCESIQLVDVFDLILGSDDTRRVPQPKQESLRRHVESCPRCRSRVIDVTTMSRGITVAFDDGSIPIAEDFEARLKARIDALDAPRKTEGGRARRKTTTAKRAAPRPPPPPPLPPDPVRIREVLAGPRPARSEPIRTGVSSAGFDPSRPAFWMPMAAALLLLAGGGMWVIQYLKNYEPPKKQAPIAARPAPVPAPQPGTEPGAPPTPEGPDLAQVPDEGDDFPPIPEFPIPAPPAEIEEPTVERPPGEPAREPGRVIAGRDPEAAPAATISAVLLHLRGLKGEIALVDRSGGEPRPYVKGAPLGLEDALSIGPGGIARIEVVGGGTFVADGGTVLSVSRVGDVHEVFLSSGRAVFETAPAGTPFRIRTPHAEVRRGTARFGVAVEDAGTSLVTIEGEAVLASGDREVVVPAGSGSRTGAGLAPEAPGGLDPVEATSWTGGLVLSRTVEFEDDLRDRGGRIDVDALAARSGAGWAVPYEWFEDRESARRAARFDEGVLRLESGTVFGPRLELVEGETYEATFRLRAAVGEVPGADTAVELLLVAQGERGLPWMQVRRIVAGAEWTESAVQAELPLGLPPGTRFWAACRSEAPVSIGGLRVERLVFPSQREVDHDFHRKLPAGWQRASGTWKREPAGVIGRPVGRLAALLVLPPTAAYLGDYAVGVAGRPGPDGAIGVALRVVDARNHYRFVCSSRDGSRNYRLEAIEEGKERVLAETAAPDDGAPGVHLEVRAHGTSLEAYADGALVLRVEDGAFRRGAVGLVALGDPGRFHRLIVEAYR